MVRFCEARTRSRPSSERARLRLRKFEIWAELKPRLVGEAGAGEGAPFDAAKEFDAEKFVQVLEIHRYRKFMKRGFSRRTISFDKAKIRQNFYFMQ